MRPEIKGYFLKEYGAWSVLVTVSLIGVGVSRALTWTLIPLFLALGLLINSKQAYMKWIRRAEDGTSLVIYLGQIVVAAVILFAIFSMDIPRLLPLLILPGTYLLMNRFAGEHFLLTEVLGFALLSLAAVLVKFLLTDDLDIRLFLGVALYFTANVFKVKTMLLRKMRYRVMTVLYAVFAVFVYWRMNLPIIALLPLADNIIAAATLYKVKLQTVGWMEVAKSLVFMGLFIGFY
jgi:hypothetical protein